MYYMVALPFEVFTPSAIAAGIETWTWVISENQLGLDDEHQAGKGHFLKDA